MVLMKFARICHIIRPIKMQGQLNYITGHYFVKKVFRRLKYYWRLRITQFGIYQCQRYCWIYIFVQRNDVLAVVIIPSQCFIDWLVIQRSGSSDTESTGSIEHTHCNKRDTPSALGLYKHFISFYAMKCTGVIISICNRFM